MAKTSLNRIEKEIMRVIIKEKRPLTINEISKISGISWITVKKYIPRLIEKGAVYETEKER